MKALEERKGSTSFLEKSLGLAGLIFELSGLSPNGYEFAKEIFTSGKSLEKFREIVAAQGGDESVRADSISLGNERFSIESNTEGAVVDVINSRIVRVARLAGAPKDKGAGIYIHKKKGEVVRAGEPLITIYAEKSWKLSNAIEFAIENPPVIVSGMILERYPSYRVV